MKESTVQIIGIIAGICTSVSLLPQLVKLIKKKKAEDISIFYLALLFIGLALWLWYGILRKDIPIIATNTFSLLMNLVVMILSIKYKQQNQD